MFIPIQVRCVGWFLRCCPSYFIFIYPQGAINNNDDTVLRWLNECFSGTDHSNFVKTISNPDVIPKNRYSSSTHKKSHTSQCECTQAMIFNLEQRMVSSAKAFRLSHVHVTDLRIMREMKIQCRRLFGFCGKEQKEILVNHFK